MFEHKGGKEVLSVEFVAELYKEAFNLPHLWGMDHPEHPWWPLSEHEAQTFAGPSARILARMTPKQQELFSRYADPLLLATALAGAMSWRIDMTRAYTKQIRIQREQEARRAGLSHGLETAVDRTVRPDGADREQKRARSRVPENDGGFGNGPTQDAFSPQ